MTVSELIEKLEKFDGHLRVLINEEGGPFYSPNIDLVEFDLPGWQIGRDRNPFVDDVDADVKERVVIIE